MFEFYNFLVKELFVIGNGYPIAASTPFLIAFVIVGVIISISVMYVGHELENVFGFLLSMVSILILMLTIGLPISQMAQLEQCKPVTATVMIDGKQEKTTLKQCRNRPSLNEPYGKWELVNGVN